MTDETNQGSPDEPNQERDSRDHPHCARDGSAAGHPCGQAPPPHQHAALGCADPAGRGFRVLRPEPPDRGGLFPVAGAAELAGAIGLLTPWLAGLAAAGLAAVMVGATIINAAGPGGGLVWLTAPLCAVFVLIAFGRRQQIQALWAAIRR